MFHTSREAEVFVPRELASEGERIWRFVEMGLQTPYFLVALRHSLNGDELDRHILFSQWSDVMALAKQQSESFSILSLQLLSPGYMNSSDGYELGRVKEVWVDKTTPLYQLYVMADGSKLVNELAEVDEGNQDMELVLIL